MMKALLSTLANACLLRSEAFKTFRDRRDVFFQGFLIIVVVSLLVGFPAFAGNVVKAAQPRLSEAQLEEATAQIEKGLKQVEPLLGFMPTEERQQLTQVVRMAKIWIAAGVEISNLNTVLPKPLGALMQAFGGWLSLPFGKAGFPLASVSLAVWLGYGLWVMLLAKLLGGRGTLAGFFGTSALYAVPHVLTFFAWIPCLGAILSLIAFLWGIVIYMKATMVSHGLTVGRALVAVFLPMLVIVLVVLVGATLVGALVSGTISNLVQS
jgi:hypothetical protein